MTHSRSRHHRQRRRRRAFTLMEMIVVVTIIALLATVIVPRLWQHVGTASVSAAKAEVNAIASQVATYLIDTGGAALNDDFDLSLLLLAPDDGGGPHGPYLQKRDDLVDPWENDYILRVPGEVNYDFDVVSMGPDGELGTPDDVTN